MPTARETLFSDLDAVAAASDFSSLFVSPGSPPSELEAARLLRNGLAVVTFNALEHFVDRRAVELLTLVSASPITYSDLPDKWKQAATVKVVTALQTHVRFMRSSGDDPVPLIQETGAALATTSGSALQLSRLTLRWTGSNLGADDLSGALGTLQVERPWDAVTSVANRAGFNLGGSAADVFRTLALTRNQAAHEPTTDVPILYLRSLPKVVAALAFGFDVLASRAARMLASADPTYLSGQPVRQSDIGLRLIDRRGSRWAEIRESRPARAFRLHPDFEVARREAMSRATTTREAVVARSAVDAPIWWATGDAA